LTDLDLRLLPATGRVANVRAYVFADSQDDEAFTILFPQEYSDYLAEAVIDTLEGLA
jgi:hypothetical protein